MENPAVRMLNRAFAADPRAVHALVCNRVPCNQALADDPTVIYEESVLVGGPTFGILGFVNGLLGEIGLPEIVIDFSEEVDALGRHCMIGFREFPPAEPAS